MVRLTLSLPRFVSALLAAGTAVMPAHATGEFRAGPWRGRALYKDAAFVNCGMLGRGGSAVLMFTLNEGGELKLGVRQSGVRFTPGKTFPGSIEINGGPANTRTFTAGQKDVLVAPMGPLKEALAALGQAQKLRLRVGGLTQDFELDGLSDGLAQLAACARKRGSV